ncbi:unnamed protein product, partial [Polarella glacialis]
MPLPGCPCQDASARMPLPGCPCQDVPARMSLPGSLPGCPCQDEKEASNENDAARTRAPKFHFLAAVSPHPLLLGRSVLKSDF